MSKKQVAVRFLELFGAVLEIGAEKDPALAKFAAALQESCDGGIADVAGDKPEAHALTFLANALAAVPHDFDLADALRSAAAAGAWYAPYHSAEVGADFADGLVSLEIAGARGLLRPDGFEAGLILVAPNVTYPLHDHVADELYYLVSGTAEFQSGFNGEPQRATPGEYSVIPSGMPHRLVTGDAPVLIVYVWTGQIHCDVLWWEHMEGDLWRRYAPKYREHVT